MTRIFIPKINQGWKEVQIPESYKCLSHDALVTIAHRFIPKKRLKGALFTENPAIDNLISC